MRRPCVDSLFISATNWAHGHLAGHQQTSAPFRPSAGILAAMKSQATLPQSPTRQDCWPPSSRSTSNYSADRITHYNPAGWIIHTIKTSSSQLNEQWLTGSTNTPENRTHKHTHWKCPQMSDLSSGSGTQTGFTGQLTSHVQPVTQQSNTTNAVKLQRLPSAPLRTWVQLTCLTQKDSAKESRRK